MSALTRYLTDDWQRFNSPAALIAHLNPHNIRIAHIYRRLEYIASLEAGGFNDKVASAGSRLLCGSAWRKQELRRSIIGLECLRAREKQWAISRMADLPVQMIGHIYFIRSPLRPNNLKIGFTTRTPELRRRSLMANSGEKLDLLGFFVGTIMDEQIFHALNSKQQIAGEWFNDPLWLPDLPFLRSATAPALSQASESGVGAAVPTPGMAAANSGEGAPATRDVTFGAPSVAIQ